MKTLHIKNKLGSFKMLLSYEDQVLIIYKLFRLDNDINVVGTFAKITVTKKQVYEVRMFNTTQIIELTKEDFTIED